MSVFIKKRHRGVFCKSLIYFDLREFLPPFDPPFFPGFDGLGPLFFFGRERK